MFNFLVFNEKCARIKNYKLYILQLYLHILYTVINSIAR